MFSPVVKHSSICVLLVMATLFDLELEQLTVDVDWSTIEAEYMAAIEAVKEVILFNGLVGDLVLLLPLMLINLFSLFS